ncbi:MAG TPA: Do family serine endopeptidase [Blastocatellia bacterium]
MDTIHRSNSNSALYILITIGALIAGALAGSVMTVKGWSPIGQHTGRAPLYAAPSNEAGVPAGFNAGFSGVASAVIPAVVTVETLSRVNPQPESPFFPNPFGDLFNFPWPGLGGGQGGAQGGGQGQTVPRPPRQGPLQPYALGSGVIVTADGYILTNNHVVTGADKIQVTLSDKRSFTARLIGSDPPSDIAVLKIDGSGLPTIPFGDSSKVLVGDIALAVGNPLGVGETVTMGIISGLGRSTGNAGTGSYQDFLQTDASINQGNSGGALVNVRGELIGIPSQILSQGGGNIGIGFAIPSAMARSVMDQLIRSGKVSRGMLGVQVGTLTPALAEKFGYKNTGGALVEDVEPGQPADRAGVKPGDIITEFQGQAITDSAQLRNLVAETGPGTTVKLKVWRDNSEIELTATLAEMQANATAPGSGGQGTGGGALAGVQVQNLTPDMRQSLNLPASAHGVVITSIEPGSNASVANLHQGDVIEEVDRQSISSVSDFTSAIQKAGKGSVLLRVQRAQQGAFYVVIQAQQ